MAVVVELIRAEADGSISFGNYQCKEKVKADGFNHLGDVYKVKTCAEITKLEKNGLFLYESVPGTGVSNFVETQDGVSFVIEGAEDAQLTLGLMEETEYEVFVGGESAGIMKSGFGGKVSLSVALENAGEVAVKCVKID